MTTSRKIAISYILTFLISFLISAGGAYLSASGGGTPITTTMIIGSIVTGLVAAAQAVQKLTEQPPMNAGGEPPTSNVIADPLAGSVRGKQSDA